MCLQPFGGGGGGNFLRTHGKARCRQIDRKRKLYLSSLAIAAGGMYVEEESFMQREE